MSEVRREVENYIHLLSDEKLVALKPLLTLLADEDYAIETDLTEEEKEIIRLGEEAYEAGEYASKPSPRLAKNSLEISPQADSRTSLLNC